MNIKTTIALFALGSMSLFGVTFENLKFSQEIDTNSLQSTSGVFDSSTNGTLQVKPNELDISTIHTNRSQSVNGITFDIVDDGFVKFYFHNELMGQELDDPIDRILINDKPLGDTIKETVQARVVKITGETISQMVQVYNPLWGKKLAVIGDSLTCTPSKDTSYSYFIAQRNNMTLVNNGRGGEKLCNHRTDDAGNITNPSTISSYTNDIPKDADFILCQIGANDTSDWWTARPGDDDTEISTNTFKGCWNSLLIGLSTNYPNAKIGMILANNWKTNVGSNSNDVINYGTRREMTQWQKAQCHRLNIPVFDPVEDTRMFIYNYKVYPTNGVDITVSNIDDSALTWYDKTKRLMGTENFSYSSRYGQWYSQSPYMVDTQHTSKNGNILLSFFYEQWMKTVLICK